MSFKFEKLDVWNKAVELSAHVHELTRKFPKEELYILTSQMKRAADSVALNIAEGSTGQSDKEFKQFLGYAVRSGIELVACLYIGKRRNIVDTTCFQALYDEAETVIRMTQALRRSLS